MSKNVKLSSVLVNLILAMILFSPLVTNVSSNSSSDVAILRPNNVECVDDSIYQCVLPISSSISHEWSIPVFNGPVQEDFIFHQEISEDSTGNIVDLDTTSITLAANAGDTITFSPWNNWVNGSSYTITYYATLTDGSSVGNSRYFTATFQNQIDIAILSDYSYGVSQIKRDLSILGLTYTKFEMSDWDSYLDSNWLSVYDKIVLPWQDQSHSESIDDGGYGYYEIIGSSQNKTILENFMSSGGTLQVHLQENEQHYEYSTVTGESYLPLNMQIESRTNGDEVKAQDLEPVDIYHPIFEDIDLLEFYGFNAESIVAESVINLSNTQQSSVPNTCSGSSQIGSTFSNLLQSNTGSLNSVLSICGYGSGGMIATTIDVELNSKRADDYSFALLGNLLSQTITSYPNGFNSQGEGSDILIDGTVPPIDPTSGEYFVTYVKSDQELYFSYLSSTSETLQVDWEISGPHDWDGYSMQPGEISHTEESEPSLIFCKFDSSSSTGCRQNVQWEVTLFLHDDNGNSRILSVIIETDDVYADEFEPVADFELDLEFGDYDAVEYLGAHYQSNQEWDLYRIYLYESGGSTVFFDASDSYDPDSTDSSNGINIYQWQVYFDKPYHEALSIDVNEYFSYDGQWAYTFSNNTLELGNDDEFFIKIVLTVYDNNGKWDEHRMFFSVAPENFFDPIIELNNTLNNTEFNEYSITVNGNITYGDNYSHINVEAAFSESDFDLTVLQKYELINDGRFSVATVLQVGDGFELTLSLQEFYDANSLGERKIYVRAIDTSREIYTDVHWTNIILFPPDGDKDGIDDYSDNCPFTLIGIEVDEFGCDIDRDKDGIINSIDDCPDEYGNSSTGNETSILIGCLDSDGDGWADRIDMFKNDLFEWIDSDYDGVGDNSDLFPFDETETHDDDLDGVGNNSDAFPKDKNESEDTDSDGYGNNADDCILVAGNSTIDLIGCLDNDGDGWSNSNDEFVNNSAEWQDTDGDGVGDNSDAFPNDSSETKDSDGDGVGDNEQLESEQRAQTIKTISIIAILIILGSLAGIFYFKKKNSTSGEDEKYNLEIPTIEQSVISQNQDIDLIHRDNSAPVVESQWTENGYTWRKMTDGSMYWWDGNDWTLYDN